ncbi:phytochelatin synthase family protein [Shewanella surugensis]|uniref:glutathione gamma-glutamylcysteinyltransferase n=1 Tax=Shewanella surugensis TaxID=212020 RepID=A0ABT0L606_9GAMM|nr:phytochelatin synthase family protein [Shewanella surugensis]MCL1123095.1 phytochelatin synthase family protein [Shewanella surugensis]
MRQKILFFISLTLLTLTVQANNLPDLSLDNNLIPFNSIKGKTFLHRSQHKNDVFNLIPYFSTQQTLTYCGPTSASMVLNALNIPRPTSLLLAPYQIFEQDNFFTPDVLNIATPAHVGMGGMTIDELSSAIKTFKLKVNLQRGSQISETDFRQDAIKAVSSDTQFIIVNYHRKALNQIGSGHFSPLAAYDEKSDRFLLLDVSRFKYPAIWVNTADLYQAIISTADLNAGSSRGYLLINQ